MYQLDLFEWKPSGSKKYIRYDGTIRWRNSKGELHRKDGPAVESTNGYKAWYLNDKRHREDGPAIIWSDGSKSWYLNDERYTEEEFKEAVQKLVQK